MSHGYVKTPSGWQTASAYYIKVGGVWKVVTNTYVKNNEKLMAEIKAHPEYKPAPEKKKK